MYNICFAYCANFHQYGHVSLAHILVFRDDKILIIIALCSALMSSTVEEVKQKGKKVWVSHFAGKSNYIQNILPLIKTIFLSSRDS